MELKSVKEFDTLSDDGDINFVKNFANSFGINYDWLDTVCVVDEDMFYKLQSGDIYPGSLLEYRDSSYNYLINSFVDLSDENIKECVNDKLLYDAMTYLKSVFK